MRHRPQSGDMVNIAATAAEGARRRASYGVSSRSLGYGVATAVVVLVFAGSGLANLVGAEHVVHDMAKLGYPRYFCMVLGTWKVLGALAVALPRLPRVKEWAYAGMIFDLTGAVASRAASGDSAAAVVIPMGIALIVASSWWLRPRDRVLVNSEV